MVKPVVKRYLPNLSAEKTRGNARKQEILRAFGSWLPGRSHAPKPRALPTALHPDRDIEFVCDFGCFVIFTSADEKIRTEDSTKSSYFYYTTFEFTCQVFEKSFPKYCDFLQFSAITREFYSLGRRQLAV